MSGPSGTVVETRYFEPLAKQVAPMFCFEIAMDGGYIAFCKDRSEGARKMCLDTKYFQKKILTLLTISEDRSVMYCRLEEYGTISFELVHDISRTKIYLDNQIQTPASSSSSIARVD